MNLGLSPQAGMMLGLWPADSHVTGVRRLPGTDGSDMSQDGRYGILKELQ
jgi:hypothetical protein